MNTLNYTQLGKIAHVQAGYAFRSALERDSDGTMRVFQAKDVRKNFIVNPESLLFINMNYEGDRLLRKGDVILSGRGFFEAAVFQSDTKIIATSSVYILRPDISKILSKYLAIFLNSDAGQIQLRKYETNTTLKAILTKDLKSIHIPLPDIEQQQIICDLHECKDRHKVLLQRKEKLYDQLFEQTIKNLEI